MSDLCQRLYLNDNFKMWLFVQNLEPTFSAISGGPFEAGGSFGIGMNFLTLTCTRTFLF